VRIICPKGTGRLGDRKSSEAEKGRKGVIIAG